MLLLVGTWIIGFLFMLGVAFAQKPEDAKLVDQLLMVCFLILGWPFVLGYLVGDYF